MDESDIFEQSTVQVGQCWHSCTPILTTNILALSAYAQFQDGTAFTIWNADETWANSNGISKDQGLVILKKINNILTKIFESDLFE